MSVLVWPGVPLKSCGITAQLASITVGTGTAPAVGALACAQVTGAAGDALGAAAAFANHGPVASAVAQTNTAANAAAPRLALRIGYSPPRQRAVAVLSLEASRVPSRRVPSNLRPLSFDGSASTDRAPPRADTVDRPGRFSECDVLSLSLSPSPPRSGRTPAPPIPASAPARWPTNGRSASP